MAGRKRTVLHRRSKDALSARKAARRRYIYLPWVDLICAGVPCQDVSVAGKRAGLKGERTGLFYEFARLLRELRPAWFVFENVPGLLSSNGGRDFAEVLRVLMVECGYGVSWRVLDSQFFGVAQRRRRVFIVGCFGKPCPAEVLFEPESGEGDIAEGREAGQGIAHALAAGSDSSGYRYDANGEDYAICDAIASPIRHNDGGSDGGGPRGGYGENLVAHSLRECDGHHGYSGGRGDGCDNLAVVTALRHLGRGGPDDNEAQGGHLVAYPLRSNERNNSNGAAVNLAYCLREDPGGIGQGHNTSYAISPPLTSSIAKNFAGSGNGNDGVGTAVISSPFDSNGVRDFASLPEGLDSARYRALGNAVTVSVAQFIAERIKAVMEARA